MGKTATAAELDRLYIEKRATQQSQSHRLPRDVTEEQVASLSITQRLVFRMLGKGMLVKQIASDMDVSRATVTSHVANLEVKLGLIGIGEVRWAAARYDLIQSIVKQEAASAQASQER